MAGAEQQDPFFRHRLALSVVATDLAGAELRDVLRKVAASGASGFADFLRQQKLASYWHHLVAGRDAAGEIEPGFVDALKQARLSEAALYLGQKSVLLELDGILKAQGIIYAAIKGAQVREQVYLDPAQRPAQDIDILINPDQREAAARALIVAGFKLDAKPDNISHEATFTRGAFAIDLHWDILRPGRTRVDLVPLLLGRRQRVGDFWGLDDSDAVFLMLVHPTFTKYVCSPNMGLISVVDFMLWLQNRHVDWDAVFDRLNDAGLKAAAWIVLKWFSMLLEPEDLPVPTSFINRIYPGPARSRYLAYWLQHDLPTRWIDRPLLIQIGLTLFLHDRASDAAYAISGLMRARRMRNLDPLLAMR